MAGTAIEQVAAELAKPEYAGMMDRDCVDAMNRPREVGTATQYRPVTIEEAYDAIEPATIAGLALALEAYASAPQEDDKVAAAAGAALYERLTGVGTIGVATGTEGRAALDAAQAAGYLTAEEHAAIVAIGTEETPVMETLWQTWGWDDSITLEQVEEARA